MHNQFSIYQLLGSICSKVKNKQKQNASIMHLLYLCNMYLLDIKWGLSYPTLVEISGIVAAPLGFSLQQLTVCV